MTEEQDKAKLTEGEVTVDETEENAQKTLGQKITDKASKVFQAENMLLRQAGMTNEEIVYGYGYMIHSFFSNSIANSIDSEDESALKAKNDLLMDMSKKISNLFKDNDVTQAESLLVMSAIIHIKLEELVENVFKKEDFSEEDKAVILENNPVADLFV